MVHNGISNDSSTDSDSARRLRNKEPRLYTEEYMDGVDLDHHVRLFSVEEKLESDNFSINVIKEMKGSDFNLEFLQRNGFTTPILCKETSGLGMKVPDSSFTVREVKTLIGGNRILDVMDVTTQTDSEMTMKEWCNYWEKTPRDRILNVISLEFSHTKFETLVEPPTVVRHTDWVNWVWPKFLKESQVESTNAISDMKYPKVQKYILMSVKGCYTDFHIDFGGTSVWYHIIKGHKVFWLIPPSEKNIIAYEQWVLSGKQADIFFGDTVENCSRVELFGGDTFFIPSGWIHAVYTPQDSLVFGGNFLHSFAIEKQLRVAQVEDTTKVPSKFRYPFYNEMLWYVLERYVYCLTGKTNLSKLEDGKPVGESSKEIFNGSNLTSFELNGLKSIIMWLTRLSSHKRCVPELVINPESLLNDAKILVDDHLNDNHELACTGKQVLSWKSPLKPSPFASSSQTKSSSSVSLTSQLRLLKAGTLNKSSNPKPELPVNPVKLCSPKAPSSSQYTVNPGVVLDKIPCSFEKLIASSGVKGVAPINSYSSNSSEITSTVTTATTPTQPVTTSFSTQTLPLDSTAAALLMSQQNVLQAKEKVDHNIPSLVISDNVSPSKTKSTTSDSSRRRRTRCKKCDACVRADCGECHFCKDMKKFGGPGRMKQSCIARQCTAPVLPHTACCMICGRDGWEKFASNTIIGSLESNISSLMECSSCWEIVHPLCLKEKDSTINLESGRKDDLPNSWECPKCVHNKATNKLTFKSPKNHNHLNNVIKSEPLPQIVVDEQEKRPKPNDPETSSEEELPSDDNDLPLVQSLGSLNSGSSSKPSFVKSCARFPLLEEAIRQQQELSKTKSSLSPLVRPGEKNELESSSMNLPLPTPATLATQTNKNNESLKDRLFRSLESLKRTNDASTQGKVKSPKKNYNPLVVKTKKPNGISKNVLKTPPKISSKLVDEIRIEASSEDEEMMDESAYPVSEPLKVSLGYHGRPLVQPMFVVRPAPLLEDASESDNDGENLKSKKEDVVQENDDDSSDEESERSKIMRKRLRKFRRPKKDNLSLERDVIFPVLPYLSRKDVINCMYVCKIWNSWAIDPRLWSRINVSTFKITCNILVGIVRRQPNFLDLSWSNITSKQLSWLLARLPQLKELKLAGCSGSCISALASSNTPLLRALDISFIDGVNDEDIREILMPPRDSRPGLLETKSRLRMLSSFSLAAADITDNSVRLISNILPCITHLDLGNCSKISDNSVNLITSGHRAEKLTSLQLYSCDNLTDACLEPLKRCPNITNLDLRKCDQINNPSVSRFYHLQTFNHSLILTQDKLIRKKASSI